MSNVRTCDFPKDGVDYDCLYEVLDTLLFEVAGRITHMHTVAWFLSKPAINASLPLKTQFRLAIDWINSQTKGIVGAPGIDFPSDWGVGQRNHFHYLTNEVIDVKTGTGFLPCELPMHPMETTKRPTPETVEYLGFVCGGQKVRVSILHITYIFIPTRSERECRLQLSAITI